MKLLCIKKEPWKCLNGAPDPNAPRFGEIVTPIESGCYEGIEYWVLEEYLYCAGCMQGFVKSCFVPLSDLDETEIHKEYFERSSEPVSAKAIPYMKQVRQWASENGLPFFTLRQQMDAVKQYRVCGQSQH